MTYEYVHKDGRTGVSEQGCWFAMIEALGRAEAGDVLDSSKQSAWRSITPVQTENGQRYAKSLLFHKETGEELGVLYKI